MSAENIELRPRIFLFERIRESLNSNPRVFVAGVVLNPYPLKGFLDTVEIVVAPKKPIYDPVELNIFLDSLVPKLPNPTKESAGQGDKSFHYGLLFFCEDLGYVFHSTQIVTVAYDRRALESYGISSGETALTKIETYRRRILVKVHPNAVFARKLVEYQIGRQNGSITNPSPDYEPALYFMPLTLLKAIQEDPQYN